MKTTRAVLNSSKRLTIKGVTKVLQDTFGDSAVEIVAGKGYFYFSGGVADNFSEQGVYVNRLNALTLEQWVGEFRRKLEQARRWM